MRGVGGESPGAEYERYRGSVMGMLGKRFPRLDEDERLAIYHDAWLRVLRKRERGEKFASLRAYLLATAGAEALNVLSRGRVPTPVGPDDPRLAALSDDAPPLDEQVVTRDQARIARSLLDTLDERQRDVLKLRWDLQLSGAEVRAALGLSARQYRRLAEEGAIALAERVEELESGQWSRRTRSLLVACLVEVTQDGQRRVGIASRRQRAEAQRLLESDPHVAALYAEVRRSVRGATALLPLPVLALGSGHGSLTHQIAELISDLRGQLTHALETTRQHTTSLYLRAADPTFLASGPRPGAAVVAVTGALALGGATYGAYEVTSPPKTNANAAPTQPTPAITPVSSPPPAPKPKSKPPVEPKQAPKPNSTTPPPPTPQPPTSVPPQPPPQQAPTPTPTTQPTEFGFED